MKTRLLTIFMIAFSATGYAGPISSGGGDPKVAQFLNISEEVCAWYLRGNTSQFAEMKSCSSIINGLKSSLDQSQKALLSFTDHMLFENGISKVAIFDRAKGSIRVNRKLWNQSTKVEKYTTVGIEIAGLAGVQNRYEFGQLITSRFSSIFSANSMTCNIKLLDLKTNKETVALPETTKSITIYDFDFTTAFLDPQGKPWRLQLLGSVPDISSSNLSLSWSIRDARGESSQLENVFTEIPFINGSEADMKVIFSELAISAHCELNSIF
ncbi:MAG: hypothetical protein ACXVCE_17135 [Bacteriovorax sp.]